jgi:alkanesulfonate monooxygenase
MAQEAGLQVFSTCPSSSQCGADYLDKLGRIGRWSEHAGCTGSLIYTDNSLVDPWLVAQALIQNTETLCPLVAVQPVYMHPYSVAKMVSSLGHLYGRRVFLNMVAGGFKNDLIALNDNTPHDQRYERLTEYTDIIQRLLDGEHVTTEGKFFQAKNLTLTPPLPPELKGGILMSGSSDAGMAAARQTGAIAIQYPEPPENCKPLEPGPSYGFRVGIVTRPKEAEAWDVADKRFPDDRQGQITRFIASKVSDSSWHKRLAQLSAEELSAEEAADAAEPQARQTYWLHPFGQYHTNCPYLVGSYTNVAAEIARYLALGYRTIILDTPAAEEEFYHIGKVLPLASHANAREGTLNA